MTSGKGIQVQLQCRLEGFELEVDLDLPGTGLTALFGHSGCGKTTLLRCIAGLQPADGSVIVNGDQWQSRTGLRPVHQRPLAYVFQDTSLFPHLNVRRNLGYGYRRIPAAQRRISFEEATEWLGLSHLLDRMPEGLSGGERQRVAIARALLTSPELLLMDEPLSALDRPSKQDIMPYLEALRDKLAIPILYVSHSTAEVARLADHIVMMDRGRIIAQGPLQETLARTDQPFGLEQDAGVIIDAHIGARDEQWHLCRADFPGGRLWLRAEDNLVIGQAIRLQVLARDISLALAEQTEQSIQNLVPAVIDEVASELTPGTTMIRLLAGQTPFLARLTSRAVHTLKLETGQSVWMQVKSVAIVD
ncbi:molybdenum ABC transporter ATP-binding protein [Marinobacter sp. M216]|uniref:Molybdenum ABC transporter ATP-binding protein n=1 Tax=Marinobacter albus TaxID=3030833 RepID=A0ABT7H8Y8_9GAMM|nr:MULTISPECIES: molybdenum ABC transporter ATP-binding protein [unclassified Marinobacter]MBW7471352.1 molybdenum ABC transporter ATP-binding protein [Marinobacter sp. F4218]MDK9556370.1 molybdenum ABC transporter ATP-binding protein [Marinobacter sp. M216]